MKILNMKEFTWFRLTMKRLLKNPIFIITLILIPIIVLGMRFSIQSGDAMIRVAIFTPSTDSNSTEALLTKHLLENSGTAITFYLSDSEESLRKDVTSGIASCGYIFPKNLEAQLLEYTTAPNPVFTAVCQDNENRTKIIDELVFSSIYDFLSFDILSQFVHQKTGNDFSPELRQYFEKYLGNQAFLKFEYADGSENTLLQTTKANYMLLPIRGMVSVLLLLAGMTGTLFWYTDKQKQIFSRLAPAEQNHIELICIASPVLLAGVFGLISLQLTGIPSGIGNELLMMFLYLLDVIAFCRILCLFLPKMKQMLAAIPIFAAGSLIACPVFADLTSTIPALQYLRWLTPVCWYLRGVHSTKGKLLMLALGIILLFIPVGIRHLTRRR